MRRSRLLAFACGLLLALAAAFAGDEPVRPTACPAHEKLFEQLDHHMVDAEHALADSKLDDAAARQKDVLDDLDALMKLHDGKGG